MNDELKKQDPEAEPTKKSEDVKQPGPDEAKKPGPRPEYDGVLLRHGELGLGLLVLIGGTKVFFPIALRDIAAVVETADAVTLRKRGLQLR